MSWTPEKEERVAALWGEGQSGGMIAHALGDTTRSAVMGKLKRLGLLGTGTPGKRRRRSMDGIRVRSTPRSTKRRAFTVGAAPTTGEPAPLRIPIIDIVDHACRWIAGDPRSDGTCCGHNTVGDLAYCGHHARRAYRMEIR
jgi:hypothetical protein